jgi:glycosyltransferase involved in cell wall biosynthesis
LAYYKPIELSFNCLCPLDDVIVDYKRSYSSIRVKEKQCIGEKLRVVYDHQIFGWQEYGGISRYFYELALAMNRQPNTEANIVCTTYINQYLAGATDKVTVFGFLVPKFPKFGRVLRILNSWIAWPVLSFLKPDILHETYYSRSPIAPKSTKVVITVFDMIHELFEGEFSRFDKTSIAKKAAIERADHVICISENTRKDLIRLFDIDPKKISVTYLGFSLDTESMQASPLVFKAPYLLYVGSRFGYKNFERLLRAFAILKLSNPELCLVCFGGGVLTRDELILANDLGLSSGDMIQMAGVDAILANLYTHAQVFVYPSLYEGFGIPPLEAMSCGCPVVCSGLSSIPEVAGEAGMYFDPLSPQDMARAIQSVLDNHDLKAELIKAGFERIKRFSWERCAAETRAIYDLVLRDGQ